MKCIYFMAFSVALLMSSSCGSPEVVKKQTAPEVAVKKQEVPVAVQTNLEAPAAVQTNVEDKITASAVDTNEELIAAAVSNFQKAVRNIPFEENLADLEVNSSRLSIDGNSIDNYLNKTLFPPLKELLKLLPAGKVIEIDGYASRKGTEEPSPGFIGNQALSEKRAEAVLNFILKKTGLDSSKFKLKANGSSVTLDGITPEDTRNCRVTLSII